MRIKVYVEVRPFSTPNYVRLVNSDKSLHLKELSIEEINQLCAQFRDDVVAKWLEAGNEVDEND